MLLSTMLLWDKRPVNEPPTAASWRSSKLMASALPVSLIPRLANQRTVQENLFGMVVRVSGKEEVLGEATGARPCEHKKPDLLRYGPCSKHTPSNWKHDLFPSHRLCNSPAPNSKTIPIPASHPATERGSVEMGSSLPVLTEVGTIYLAFSHLPQEILIHTREVGRPTRWSNRHNHSLDRSLHRHNSWPFAATSC